LTYSLRLVEAAIDDIGKLDKGIAQRVLLRLIWLADHTESVRHTSLEGPLAGAFKFRIGDHRAIYTIDHGLRTLTVRSVDHRREAYRDRS
jgi:mRNA interferase RelE/StbE